MEAVEKQELQERVKVGLEKFAEAMRVFVESISKGIEFFHNLNEALRNSECSEEAKQTLCYDFCPATVVDCLIVDKKL